MASNDRLGSIRAAGGVIGRPDYFSHLNRVYVPTLIVAGEADRATPPAEAEKLHKLIAGSRLELISGAGHALPIEKPAVSELVDQFLAGLTRSDSIIGEFNAD